MTPGEIVTGLGYLTGGLVLFWAARTRGVATEGMGLVALAGFVCAILGAKVTQAVFEGAPQAALSVSAGGRSLLGGLLFGWLGVEVAKRRLGIRRSTGDLFALALPAGEAVGRIGCFLNGCCYGAETDGPLAVWQHGAMRHPAQIYSSVASMLLFGFLLWMRPRVRIEGELFRLYLVGFGAFRFGLEFLRWRESTVFGLSLMQWSCLELIVYGTLWIALKERKLVLEGR
jgi:phosphatidylglycerol:prolipoprotein diacylglycerol transferase